MSSESATPAVAPAVPAPATPAAATGGPAVRLVLQRVDSASLLVDNVARRVSIRNGVIVFVAFFAGARAEHVARAVKTICETKIFSFENPLSVSQPPTDESGAAAADAAAAAAVVSVARGKPKSLVDDRDLSVLVVPQASIAGRVKAKAMQYHAQSPKDEGLALYTALVDGLRSALLPKDVIARLDANGEERQQGEQHDEKPREEQPEAKAKKGAAAAAAAAKAAPAPGKGVVRSGTYGNTQSLTLDTFGPMTHVVDIDL